MEHNLPLILTPINGQVFVDEAIVVSGVAAPCNSVKICINGCDFHTKADGDGFFNIQLPQILANGTYEICVFQIDCCGCESCPAKVIITVASVCRFPFPPIITRPVSGSIITENQPGIYGIADPGNQVQVCIDLFCDTTISAEDGTFFIQFEAPLQDGTHTITATQTNACGQTSADAISTFVVKQPCLIPDPPVITYPAEGQVVTDTVLFVVGTADPGNSVQVCIDLECTTTIADLSGNFAAQFPNVFENGTHIVTATQTNACGQISDPATVTFEIALVCAFPEPPVILLPAEGETVIESQPFILGIADPGSTVQVCIDDICTTTISTENSDFSAQASIPLVNGLHTIVATQTNVCDQVSATAIATFTVLIEAPVLSIVTIERGQSFRTIDADISIGNLTEDLLVYYLLLAPDLPVPTANEIIDYNDALTLIDGTAARGQFTVRSEQENSTITVVLPGRQVPSPLPMETGVVDGFRYILYIVGVTVVSHLQSNLAYSPNTAIGMPFDSGNGTLADPFVMKELTFAELVLYPDLLPDHPISRAGIYETARELDNIEGMQVLYDENLQNGIADSLALTYSIQGNFNLAGYAVAYDGDGWRPIGNIDFTHYLPELAPHIFTGTLNGNASQISNLPLTPGFRAGRWVQYVGFIGYAQDATVTNIRFQNVTISPAPSTDVGILRAGSCCAYAKDTTFDTIQASEQTMLFDFVVLSGFQVRAGSIAGELVSGNITNATVTQLHYFDSASTYAYLGGLAGRAYNSLEEMLIENCNISSVTAEAFVGTGLYLGGAFGYLNATQLCTINLVSSSLIISENAIIRGGGLIGYLTNTAPVILTNLTVSGLNLLDAADGWYTGGIVALIVCHSILTMSDMQVSSSSLTATYGSGGLIGSLEVSAGAAIEISNFTTLVNITTINAYAGGMIGLLYREPDTSLYIHDGSVLVGSIITGPNNSGGLIGDAFHETGVTHSFIFIQRCTSAATVIGSDHNTGGLLGYGNFTALSECSFSGTVTGITNVGGLAGNVSNNYMGDCVCTGSVSGATAVGGVIGYDLGSTTEALPTVNPPFLAIVNTIERTSMRGTIFVIPVGSTIGGFIGEDAGIFIDECFSLASIDAIGVTNVGAFLGFSRLGVENFAGNVTDCYATGTVTNGGTRVSAFSGSNVALINRCYSNGSASGVTQVGGIAGIQSSTTQAVSNCFSLGELVEADTSLAARIANIMGGGLLLNNFALDTLVLVKSGVTVSPVSNANGVDGETVTLAELEAAMIGAGWSPSVWNFTTISTLGRPVLINNPE